MARVNIRAQDRKSALDKFKQRYGKNYSLTGVMYNNERPKGKYGMKSYTCIGKRKE